MGKPAVCCPSHPTLNTTNHPRPLDPSKSTVILHYHHPPLRNKLAKQKKKQGSAVDVYQHMVMISGLPGPYQAAACGHVTALEERCPELKDLTSGAWAHSNKRQRKA